MSYYVANIGEVIIKPEYREDFGYFFEERYLAVKDPLLKKFIVENILPNIDNLKYDKMHVFDYGDYDHDASWQPLRGWRHDNNKEAWRGKYKTSYDKETGRFTYGICYNQRRGVWWAITEFIYDILDDISEQVLFQDEWNEDMR